MTARPPAATPATTVKAATRAGKGIAMLADMCPAAREEEAAALELADPALVALDMADDDTPVTMADICQSHF